MEELALAGVKALADFIREIGLPTTLTEMGITDKETLRNVAESSNITVGCRKKLDADGIYEILVECL